MPSVSGSENETTAVAQAGQIVGSRFHLREPWSESAGARTFLGTDFTDGREVVIKIVAAHTLHPGALMRLEYQATQLQRLRSPWLDRIVHVGRDRESLLIVYEAVPGRTLRSMLESGPLSIAESLAVGRALFSALRDMHWHHLLHRAVRPGNVIVDRDQAIGSAMLVDFEPPALEGETAQSDERSLDVAMYLSPEQAGSIDQDVTEASDLYAAGVVLFHCLAGRPPFTGSTLGSILFDHMTGCVPELRALGIAVPRALDELVGRLLRKDPRDRYQSAEAVLADLEAIAAGAFARRGRAGRRDRRPRSTAHSGRTGLCRPRARIEKHRRAAIAGSSRPGRFDLFGR